MKILNIGPVSLYSSTPGSSVKGYIDVEGTTSDQTVDVLWAMGTYDSGTGHFSISGYILDENITFLSFMSIRHLTGTFATPDAPGTWDLLGILADDIRWEGENLIVEGQHGTGAIAENGWTISSAAELQALNVGVQGA